MPLETVHLQFDRLGEHYDLTFSEQEEASEGSVKINGRQYVVAGESAHMAFLRAVISDLSAEKDTPAGHLRGELRSHGEVENLFVESSLSRVELLERMQDYLRKMEEEKGFSGSVLVKKGGERLICQGHGVSDAEGTPNTAQTRFWIASLTKQLTAAAIMLLVQEGRLSLDDEINTVLPERFRNERWNGITVRQLLTHASGIPDYGGSPEDGERESVFTLDEIVAQFSGKELNFDPGRMFEYSNANYALLGGIIENLSGMSYEEFMGERIFRRAGVDMRATGMFSSYAEAPPATGFYLEKGGEVKSRDHREMPIHISKAYSAGAIISTLEDMDRWDRALYDDTFLFPASRREIARTEARIEYAPEYVSYDRDVKGRAVPKEGEAYKQVHYGFGVGVRGDGKVLVAAGYFPGFPSFMARNTDTRDCVIILGNREMVGSDIHGVCMHLWEMLSW